MKRRNNMKKVLIVIIAVCIVLPLCACGGKIDSESSAEDLSDTSISRELPDFLTRELPEAIEKYNDPPSYTGSANMPFEIWFSDTRLRETQKTEKLAASGDELCKILLEMKESAHICMYMGSICSHKPNYDYYYVNREYEESDYAYLSDMYDFSRRGIYDAYSVYAEIALYRLTAVQEKCRICIPDYLYLFTGRGKICPDNIEQLDSLVAEMMSKPLSELANAPEKYGYLSVIRLAEGYYDSGENAKACNEGLLKIKAIAEEDDLFTKASDIDNWLQDNSDIFYGIRALLEKIK